jgi:hypothetical protein
MKLPLSTAITQVSQLLVKENGLETTLIPIFHILTQMKDKTTHSGDDPTTAPTITKSLIIPSRHRLSFNITFLFYPKKEKKPPCITRKFKTCCICLFQSKIPSFKEKGQHLQNHTIN